MQRNRLLIRQLFVATVLLGAALTAAAQVSTPQTMKAPPADEDAQALALLGLRLADAGRHAEAVEAYQRALRLAPNDVAVPRLAQDVAGEDGARLDSLSL